MRRREKHDLVVVGEGVFEGERVQRGRGRRSRTCSCSGVGGVQLRQLLGRSRIELLALCIIGVVLLLGVRIFIPFLRIFIPFLRRS